MHSREIKMVDPHVQITDYDMSEQLKNYFSCLTVSVKTNFFVLTLNSANRFKQNLFNIIQNFTILVNLLSLSDA